EFGAARDALSELDFEGTELDPITLLSDEITGHLDYISPEQGVDEHAAGPRSDLYSLGCVLDRCLTGEVVFPDANPIRKRMKHATAPAPRASELVPEVHRELSDVIATLLAKRPEDRYRSAEDARWALEQMIQADKRREAVAAEISEDFLAWASSTRETSQPDEIPSVVADPGFLGFLEYLSDEEQEAEAAAR
ncbi:MAG: hypothetical protein KY476_26165, partial [Planctomycetes bacterium]|nr:hypothetical protein [Planctomycetota bacterium]